MRTYSLLALVLTVLFLEGCSCSKKVETYSQWDMWKMAIKIEPDIELVGIANHESDRRVICANYGEGCVKGTGKRFKLRKVELLVIMFKDEKSAKQEARRIGQWYAKNWLFDDVTNEPVLESFVKEAFQAKPALPEKDNHSSLKKK